MTYEYLKESLNTETEETLGKGYAERQKYRQYWTENVIENIKEKKALYSK